MRETPEGGLQVAPHCPGGGYATSPLGGNNGVSLSGQPRQYTLFINVCENIVEYPEIMVDPLTFIGAAASITGIVESLAKTVSTLHELRSRWKQADFTFINLIAQLTALKAALNKLEEWMDAGLDEGQDPYHQLVIDLELNITCCRMLTHKIDSEVSELYQDANSGLDSQSKFKLMIKNGTIEGLQKMVERQTSILTLLLTVCNR